MIPAQEALDRLRAGNERFVSSASNLDPRAVAAAVRDLADGQTPFAIILACSDSRVAPQLIFDQGPGSLFVVRIAGNVATPEVLGSIEFAVNALGSQLVVVLGHTGCGAVAATVDTHKQPPEQLSPNLGALVGHITPALESVLAEEPDLARAELLNETGRANVHHSADLVRAALGSFAPESHPLVVGAEYQLETGVIEFLS